MSSTITVLSNTGTMGVTQKSGSEAEEVRKENTGVDGEAVPKNTLKTIQDMTRQLDYVTSKCNSVESLFGSELIARRNKLRNMCEQYMFECPRVNCVPARDKLWRYVYYEAISKAKRLKQRDKWTSLERVFVKQHLLNGIGQLSLLMLRLQQTVDEFKGLKLRFCTNGFDNIMPLSLVESQKNNDETADQEWATDVLRLFLLNIGDLCRYLTELYAKVDQDQYLNFYDRAQDYYTQAFFLNPESGFAHNQLGNLSIKRNNGLDSIYYFLYSLVAKTPCQGALANLRQLLETQLVSFATLSGAFVCTPVDIFSHNFIKILNEFFGESPTPFGKFEKLCEDTVGSFVILLAEGKSLDDGFLFRVISICMMTVWHLLPSKTTMTSSAVCFSIGMFVHLMKRLFTILKSHSKLKEVTDGHLDEEDLSSIDGAEVVEYLSKSASSSLPPDANDQDQTSTVELAVEEQHVGSKRRVLKNRRRDADDYYTFIHQNNEDDDWNDNDSESTDYLRESGSSTHSVFTDSGSEDDLSDVDDDGDEDFSEEDNGNHIHKASDQVGSSEASDISYQAEIEIERKAAALKLSQSSDEVISDFVNNSAKVRMKDVVDLEDLQKCWPELEPIIVAILPFTRWLKCWLPVQHALAASTEKEVMEMFCQVLNLLESTNWSIALKQQWNNVADGEEANIPGAQAVESQLIRDWKNVIEGNLDENLFSLELPEDLSMLGWNHLIPSGSAMHGKCTTKNNMIVTRIGRLLVFGQWLVGTEAFAVIRSEKSFLVPSVEEYKRHMRKIQIEKFSRRLMTGDKAPYSGRRNKDKQNGRYTNSRRRRPMQRNRVRDDFHTNQDDKIYVLFDLSAVLKYLRVIQKMSRHSKFMLVLPFSVSRSLDTLKDGDEEGSKVARIANRWLERNSNASYKNAIQLLRKEDRVALDSAQYPSDQTKESFEFFEILESCNYIREQVKHKKHRPNGHFFKDARDNYRVLYLTGNKNLLDSTLDADRGFNPIAISRSAYVYLDRIARYQNRNRKRKPITNGYCGG